MQALTTNPSTGALIEACGHLFGSDVNISPAFLEYIQISGVKTAYKKRAFEFHPDRAKTNGGIEWEMEKRFKAIKDSYEILLSFLEKGQALPKSEFKSRANSSAPKSRLPRRKVLLGELLYYANDISSKQLAKALMWQRNQRPLYGQLAVKAGYLTYAEILQILKFRREAELFGACALRKGFLKQLEHLDLLKKQRVLHRNIGEYFVKHGLITADALTVALKKQHAHNRSIVN